MGLENVNRCQHVKVNGTQCGSPALRRRRALFFSCAVSGAAGAGLWGASLKRRQARFEVPLLEDANSVQMGLMQVMQLLGTGQMEHKTAALMLYALQTASCNLRNTEFEARDATDVVIDRDTVNRTCMGGPQWVEEDFDEEADEVEGERRLWRREAEGGAVEGAAVAGEAGVKACAQEPAGHVTLDEARKQVQRVVMDWVVETVRAEGCESTRYLMGGIEQSGQKQLQRQGQRARAPAPRQEQSQTQRTGVSIPHEGWKHVPRLRRVG